MSSSSSSSSSPTTVSSVLTTAALTVGATWAAHRWYQTSQKQKHLGNFPSSTPFFFPSLDVFYLLSCGTSFDKFVAKRSAALKSDTFIIRFPMQPPTLVITNPADQAELMRKENKIGLVPELPQTVETHGPGSLQLAHGQKHNFYRKIFSSLLSPAALQSFVPYIHEAFTKMWVELEEQSSQVNDGGNSTVIIEKAICKTQFFLMAKILYGMTPENTPVEVLLQMRDDFEAQLEGHFAPPKSSTRLKAKEASQRLHRILAERFQAVLKKRQVLWKANDSEDEGEEKKANPEDDTHNHITNQKIGNAMETIADALIKEGVDKDEKVIADTVDNLDLLLEASHGTTMTMTTNTLFYLNHPDNVAKLQKLRREVKSFQSKEEAQGLPNYEQLKGEMPYADATIKEAIRICPIVSAANYEPKGDQKVFTFKGREIQGPLNLLVSWGHCFSDSAVFPQPELFLPERWIKNDAGARTIVPYVSEQALAAFKPFGMGRHICLGYQLAQLVMKSSLYCFARDERRVIQFDVDKVKKQAAIFPNYSISDGFPGQVVRQEIEVAH